MKKKMFNIEVLKNETYKEVFFLKIKDLVG